MSTLFRKLLKAAPAALGLSFLVTQGVMAAPEPTIENSSGATIEQSAPEPTIESPSSANVEQPAPDVMNPQEALGILRQRPELSTPLNRNQSQQFKDTTSGPAMSQVTNISELRDVSPTEWAFEALRSLVERYGCIVGYPDRTFRGDRALSRWEFAAGLNACLNTIERLLQENVAVLREDIEKLKRLAQEFEQELIALGARVSNLEERTAYLEDHQFSTTTKLAGEVIFTTSAAWGERALDSRERDLLNQGRLREGVRRIDDNATLGFRTRLNLNTSFTGKDRLTTRIQTGTIVNYANFTGTEAARLGHDVFDNADVEIDNLYYRFPVGNLTAWVGTSALDIDDIFDVGNPFNADSGNGALSRWGRYDSLTMRGPEGRGIGFAYKFNDIFTVRGLYLSENGNSPDLGEGLFNGNYSAGGQLGITPSDSLTFNFHYLLSYYTANSSNITQSTGSFVDPSIRGQVSGRLRNQLGRGTARDPFLGAPTLRDSYGMNANWRINQTFNLTGYVGYSLARAQGVDTNGQSRRGFGADEWSWMAGLNVVDIFKEGAVFTVMGGATPNVRRIDALTGDLTIPDQDTPYIIEGQYKYPLNKNITITPGVYVIIEPDGSNQNNSIWVGVVRTTFKF